MDTYKINNIPEPKTIHIDCECGNKDSMNLENFTLNIVGILQFKCKKCGKITSTPGLL